jgi:hypothetical protein
MREPRLRALVLVALLIATPAVALQWRCLGGGCEPQEAAGGVPFCGLDERTRQVVEAGYRADRSPDVLAIAADGPGVATSDVPWPDTAGEAEEVPIALTGPGLEEATLPRGAGLDRIAPSLALAAGLDRPFPRVRSGTAFDGVAPGRSPLIVIIAWVGAGSRDLRDDPTGWPTLARLMRTGSGTTHGSTGSVPVDPAATLTTLGTGGLPFQHGITGSIVRGDDGLAAPAFGARSPRPVIASLAEDLDEASGQAARIALVAGASEDRGLIGSGWYVDSDEDDVTIGGPAVASVRRLLSAGYGSDEVPDLIGVTLRGRPHAMDEATARLVDAVRSVPGAVIAVAGTGSGSPASSTPGADVAADLAAALGVGPSTVDAVAAGGLFLRHDGEVSADRVAEGLRAQTGPDGGPRFTDAFPGYLVELARYC